MENFAKDFRHHTDSAREENLLSSSGDITATRVVQKSLPERDSRKLPVRRAIRRKEAKGCRQSAAQLALQGAARSRCVTGRVQQDGVSQLHLRFRSHVGSDQTDPFPTSGGRHDASTIAGVRFRNAIASIVGFEAQAPAGSQRGRCRRGGSGL